MHTILLTTDTADNAKLLADFLATVRTVKSISIDPASKDEYNWTNPSRAATDEEFEQLALEMEQDTSKFTQKQVIGFVNKELKEWRQRKK